MKRLMQKSRTRQELLDNTVRHFYSTNRSVRDGGCRYRAGQGLACSIGRELSDDLARKFDLYDRSSLPHVFHKLPRRLRRLGVLFLEGVQLLHDVAGYWDESGLSDSGRRYVKGICEKYQLKTPALISNQN
jgi:hypothetical protein